MSDTKRRTTTSTAVKRRYNDKTYTQFRAPMRNEEYAEIDAFIQSKGWSKAEFIREAYDHLRAAEYRRSTSVYYTCSADSNIANIIVCVDGIAADFTESLPELDFCDSPDDLETGLVSLITRWRDTGTLEDTFYKLPASAKYPASEIFTRFPTAKKLESV